MHFYGIKMSVENSKTNWIPEFDICSCKLLILLRVAKIIALRPIRIKLGACHHKTLLKAA